MFVIKSLVKQVCTYLRETTLVVQYAQYPMRLSGDEVKTGLVVAEGLLLPLDLLPHVLLLHTQQKSSSGRCMGKTPLTQMLVVCSFHLSWSIAVSTIVCKN